MTLSDFELTPEEQAVIATEQLRELYNNYYPYLINFLKDKELSLSLSVLRGFYQPPISSIK